MRRYLNAFAVIFAVWSAVDATAASPAPSDKDMVRIQSKKLKAVYAKPGADFKVYTKVMLDPVHLALMKNWQRDYNSAQRGSARITDADVQRGIDAAVKKSTDIFAQAFTKGGYAIVTAPGADVLRVRVSLVDIVVTAPDVMSATRSRTYARNAGSAKLIVNAYDSTTGAHLGSATDTRLAGDRSIMMRRTSISNQMDFDRLVSDWARISVDGLSELKSSSPAKTE